MKEALGEVEEVSNKNLNQEASIDLFLPKSYKNKYDKHFTNFR